MILKVSSNTLVTQALILHFVLASGFLQSLEFLKKNLEICPAIYRPRESLEIEIKSGKNGKSLEFCLFVCLFFCSYNKFSFWSNDVFAAHHEKSSVTAFLMVSINDLFDNRESGRKILLFWKKVWNFGSKDLCESFFFFFYSLRTALRIKSMGLTAMFVESLLFNSVLIYYNAFF